jgi:hypothetical protein
MDAQQRGELLARFEASGLTQKVTKRLEKGRFNWPRGPEAASLSFSPETLTILLAGIDLKHSGRRMV